MKIQRKYMAHYLNAAFSDPEASYVPAGPGPGGIRPRAQRQCGEEVQHPGRDQHRHRQLPETGGGFPYYAEEGDPLFEKLQAILDGDLVLDDLKTDMVEVKLWGDEDGAYPAVKEECYIEIVSYAATPPATRSPSMCTTPASRPRAPLTRPPGPLRRRNAREEEPGT